MSGDAFLGLDLGTSSLKAVAIDAGGEVLATAYALYPTDRAQPGRAEQDPRHWIGAMLSALQILPGTVPKERWAAIGLSAMIPTLVTVGPTGDPIGPAITWEDGRAQAEGDALRAEVGEDELYRATGQRVDGRYLLPMFRWIERYEPERAARTARLLGAKDFLFSWLTGEAATDPSTATGFGCFDPTEGKWIERIASGVTLPEVRSPTSTAPLDLSRAEELELRPGIPVCLGAADSVAGALGLGVTDPGECAYLAGTSTVILGIADRPTLDPASRFLVTPLAIGDRWGLEMDLVSTGSALSWAAGFLGVGSPVHVLELAEGSEPGARGMTFLPYLGMGEQGALWDPRLRGSMHGLTLSHGREDVARALVEAIVLESRRCLGVLDQAGLAPPEIRAAGPMVDPPLVRQLLADATQRPVVAAGGSAELSVAAFGAALLAANALAGLDVGPSARARPWERVEPDPAVAEFWDELWDRHERLREAAIVES